MPDALLLPEPIRIYLADDDEDDRLEFSEALAELHPNAALNTFHDGHDLIEYLFSDPAVLPDLIFLDVNMPKKNGMECLAEIRADERLRNVTVAIYSTSANPQEIDEAFRKGATRYLNKVSQFEKLKTILRDVLSRKMNTGSDANDFLVFQ